MLIKLSKNNPLFQYALVIIVSLLLWGKTFMETGFSHSGSYLSWGISLLCAIGFCLLLTRHRISRSPGLHAVVLLCLVATTLHAGYFPRMWVYLLFLLSFYYLLDIYGKEKPYPALFNAIFFWSTGTLFFPELIFTLPCFWIILLTYAVGNWHVWAASLLAMGTPFLLTGAYDLLWHENILQQTFSRIMIFGPPSCTAERMLGLALLCFCIVLAFISIFSMQKYLQGLEITERRKVASIIVMFLYLTVFMATGGGNINHNLFPLFMPVAFLCTNAILYMNNGLLKEILFALILTAGIGITWFG